MTPSKKAELEAAIRKALHNLTNCQQAVWGFFELGEYRKSYILCLECRSEYADLAAKLSQLDSMNDPEAHES
jgi:hypothetical protein